MTTEEILEYQRLAKAFQATELGALFNKFHNLTASAWQSDAQDAASDMWGPSKRTERLFEECDAVEKELRTMLYRLVGVE